MESIFLSRSFSLKHTLPSLFICRFLKHTQTHFLSRPLTYDLASSLIIQHPANPAGLVLQDRPVPHKTTRIPQTVLYLPLRTTLGLLLAVGQFCHTLKLLVVYVRVYICYWYYEICLVMHILFWVFVLELPSLIDFLCETYLYPIVGKSSKYFMFSKKISPGNFKYFAFPTWSIIAKYKVQGENA